MQFKDKFCNCHFHTTKMKGKDLSPSPPKKGRIILLLYHYKLFALGVDAYASFYNVNPELISGSIGKELNFFIVS